MGVGDLKPMAAQASHSESIIPRSTNDFVGAFSSEGLASSVGAPSGSSSLPDSGSTFFEGSFSSFCVAGARAVFVDDLFANFASLIFDIAAPAEGASPLSFRFLRADMVRRNFSRRGYLVEIFGGGKSVGLE